AKEQASAVAGTAKEQASAVAGTAKEQAGAVVAEAKEHAQDLLGDLRRQIAEQGETQRDRLATVLREVAEEFQEMAGASSRSGYAAQLVRQFGERVQTWSTHIDGAGASDLLDQTRSFARRKPGTFLLGALAAGILAGRATRSATANSSRTSDAPIGQRDTTPEVTAQAPAATVDLTVSEPAYAGATYPTTATSAVGTTGGYDQGHGGQHTYGEPNLTGQNPNEDLVPRHIASDVPSISNEGHTGPYPSGGQQ
ncbi:hypothetical protein, partial [Kineococcus glutinatus]|uniref:hypothetical protein n=1 Tax=Kineococcus glutinatus TaxID=1070872 RepID=UPI0031E96886